MRIVGVRCSKVRKPGNYLLFSSMVGSANQACAKTSRSNCCPQSIDRFQVTELSNLPTDCLCGS